MFSTSIWILIRTATLLGIGLAMDALSVSVAHGIVDDEIARKRNFIIVPFLFSFFQMLMPLLGWLLIFGLSSIPSIHNVFLQIIPPVSLIILCFLGIKMIVEFAKKRKEPEKEKEEEITKRGALWTVLIFEAIATSIDALSSGLAMYEYNIFDVLLSIFIIFVLTFIICFFGYKLGLKIGFKISDYATLIGGIILIFLGVTIFIRGELKTNWPEIIPDWLLWLI